MGAAREIDSFVLKFKNLLVNGVKASLMLEADNGEAFVTLKAGVGLCTPMDCFPPNIGPKYFYPNYNHRSPSYRRRQERRRSNRQSNEQADPLSEEVPVTAESSSVLTEQVDPETDTEMQACVSSVDTENAVEAVIDADKVSLESAPEEGSNDALEPVAPAEKAVSENVVGEETADQTQQKIAEKQSDERRWLCVLHGCIGEEFRSYEEIKCDCCGVDTGCQVVVYTSDEEYDDSEGEDPT